jgi:hypothetical protein
VQSNLNVTAKFSAVRRSVPLATLICERDAAMAQITLPRLMRFCRDADSITIFEDGSLTDESRSRLLASIPNAHLVTRTDLDEMADDFLAGLPNSRAHWREHPLALKLLGLPHALDCNFVFLDADILFVRPFHLHHVFDLRQSQFVFMKDLSDGYSARSVDLRFRHGLRPVSRLNSGIMAIPKDGYDPDFIEWFLGVPEFRQFTHLLEQTCWSVMARSHRIGYVDDRKVWCADRRRKITTTTIGVHYIYDTKPLLQTDAESYDFPDQEPEDLTVIPAPSLTIGRMAFNGLRRVLRHRS